MRVYFLELFFGYIINHQTKEIHKIKNVSNRCGLINCTNIRYGNWVYIQILLLLGYNGCYHCFKSKNTD